MSSTIPIKISRLFALLFGWAVIVAVVGCNSPRSNTGRVLMRNDAFELNRAPFIPLTLNYIVNLRVKDDSIWAGPTKDYARVEPDRYPDRATLHAELKADMELIRGSGFNTVRLVGLGEILRDRPGYFIGATTIQNEDTIVALEKKDERYLSEVETILRIVREAGLRTILLTTVHADRPETEDVFKWVAKRVTNDTALMAFDMFNEPLYFDKPERPKPEAVKIAAHWHDLVREHAPNQLYTVGLTGIRETFEFDPNLLKADFISFHPYEYEPDQVRNEMKWYHDNVDVPWIIGETAIPADNDSVPYADQKSFAQRVMEQSCACGSIGFSWWQYKDVAWYEFHPSYMGVFNREGVTRTKSGALVKGTAKPVLGTLMQFDPNSEHGPCLLLQNYRNYSEGKTSKIMGRLLDENGTPINDGVILGWNEHWNKSYHTTSGPDGRFELKGDVYFCHWMVSATRYDMVRGDADPLSMIRDGNILFSQDLGEMILKKVDP